MLLLICGFLMSFGFVHAVLPSVIKIAREKGLVAHIEERSSHAEVTPHVGGTPMFLAILFTLALLTPMDGWGKMQYILAALVLCFMVGTKDDIMAMRALTKLAGILIAVLIVTTRGEVRLFEMYELFGMRGELPFWVSVAISIATIVVISNAFNLIDGINGLAAGVGMVATITFGIWFYVVGDFHFALLSVATAGALLGFFFYNVTPAQTFMGDAGSLVIGLILAVLTIEFIDTGFSESIPAEYRFRNPIAVAVAILIVPLFDTIRVFATRIYRGKSPFSPDRRHLHHLLVDCGLTHMAASAILVVVSMFYISLVFVIDPLLDLHTLLAVEIVTALLLTFILHRTSRRIVQEKALAEEATGGTVTRVGSQQLSGL